MLVNNNFILTRSLIATKKHNFLEIKNHIEKKKYNIIVNNEFLKKKALIARYKKSVY